MKYRRCKKCGKKGVHTIPHGRWSTRTRPSKVKLNICKYCHSSGKAVY